MEYEVCLSLKDIGMNKKDMEDIAEYNEDAYFIDVKQCDFVIDFLKQKGLLDEEICNLLIDNPYMISVEKGRALIIDDLLNGLGLIKKDKKELIIKNSHIYTANPVEVKDIINYMKNSCYNKEDIRRKFLDDEELITASLDEVKIKVLRKE